MSAGSRASTSVEPRGGWTGAVRRMVARRLPVEELLPTQQPSFVRSWTYVFGVITIAALIWLLVSGSILALRGPQWWHQSTTGKYFVKKKETAASKTATDPDFARALWAASEKLVAASAPAPAAAAGGASKSRVS